MAGSFREQRPTSMTDTIDRIADYASALTFADLAPSVIRESKRRLIDTVGCTLAGLDTPPARIAQTLARRANGSGGAYLLGTRDRVLPELAAFANGVAGRVLDGNDCCTGGGGHPSDSIAAILAAAGSASADGRAVIAAIAVAYEIHQRLFAASRIFAKGFDHVLYTAIASAAASSRLFGLSRDELRHAASLATTANLALGATRRGELSMWKGCAGANAARNGLFAAIAAKHGMTGPQAPIDGTHGLAEITGGFHVDLPAPRDTAGILQTDMKEFATEFHSQGPMVAALELARGIDPAQIERIAIHTYTFAYKETGSGAEKWRPKTRETADHSLPYTVAAVLVDGEFSEAIFAPDRFADTRILALADKITVHDDPSLSSQVPNAFPCRIEMTVDGRTRAFSLQNPRGHHDNPLSDDDVCNKFTALAARALTQVQASRLLEELWDVERWTMMDRLFEQAAAGNTREGNA
jgi:2-methylcitrate dehydratase